MSGPITRALLRRCPHCGQGKAFESYFHLRESCPVCGYRFEREEGYWTGAMIINIAACEIWFLIGLVGILLATVPDVNWVSILVVMLVTNGILPIVFYPFSKTIWMALDLKFHPVREDEPA